MNDKHIPVLLHEAIENLAIKEDGIYVDLTLGRGGHSEEILKRIPRGTLIGIDQDETAIKESEERLRKVSNNFTLIHDNFVNILTILKDLGIDKVDGILADLGVSSPQFDDPDRGFSYRYDSELDMRMDLSQSLTAKEIVNNYSLEQLNRIFRDYGEEKYSYSIAKNIVKAREAAPINTTFELVEIIKKSKPQKELKKVGHPAKQVFQALRIATNDELGVLEKVLQIAPQLLKKEGRLVIITFHSLEDRLVKQAFKELSVVEGNRYDLPIKNVEKDFYLPNRGAILPKEEEIANNHRSVSAKLRVLAKK